MKNSKKSLIALTLMIAVVLVAGCGKDPVNNNNTNIYPTGNNNKPVVETADVTDISSSSVVCGGVVRSEGGSPIVERGVCWGKQNNPLLSDSHLVVEGDLGEFSCRLSNLDPNTNYYLRAYAINGTGIGYGSVVRFKTLSEQPSGFSPSIAVLQGEEYVHDGDVIQVNEEFNIGFVMSSSIETGQQLASLTVVINDESFETVALEGTEYIYERTLALNIRDDMTNLVITATVSDVTGRTASVTMTLIIDETQYLVAEAFEWNRHGAASGTGLDEFGLKWERNQKEIFAVIEPVEGAVLYEIPAEYWYQVTTTAEKAALFSDSGAAVPIRDYRGVSAYASNTYNDVIATLYNGEYHLIHITESIVYAFKGIDITIRGEVK